MTNLSFSLVFVIICFVVVHCTKHDPYQEKQVTFNNTTFSKDDHYGAFNFWLKSIGIDAKIAPDAASHVNQTRTKKQVHVKDLSQPLKGALQIELFSKGQCSGQLLNRVIAALPICTPIYVPEIPALIAKSISFYKDSTDPEDVYRFKTQLHKDINCADVDDEYPQGTFQAGKCGVYGAGFRLWVQRIPSFRKGVPDPVKQNLPVLIAAYRTAEDCRRNDGKTGVMLAMYLRKNYCLQGDYRDTFINGCDAKGQLVGTKYGGFNRRCHISSVDHPNNKIEPFRYTPGGRCDQDRQFTDFVLSGRLNHKCLK